jgi:hypothetical protein
MALGGIGPDASAAIQPLIDLLKETDQNFQDAVFVALENIDPNLEANVTILREARDRRASVNGKYVELAQRLRDPDEMEYVSIFQDGGLRKGVEYFRGHQDLPEKGYWVYLYPYWYIWSNQTKR